MCFCFSTTSSALVPFRPRTSSSMTFSLLRQGFDDPACTRKIPDTDRPDGFRDSLPRSNDPGKASLCQPQHGCNPLDQVLGWAGV